MEALAADGGSGSEMHENDMQMQTTIFSSLKQPFKFFLILENSLDFARIVFDTIFLAFKRRAERAGRRGASVHLYL